jgi:hypothetical protein
MAVRVHAEALSQNKLAYSNHGFVSVEDFRRLVGETGVETATVPVRDAIFLVRPRADVTDGHIQLNTFQRKAAAVSFTDDIDLRVLPPNAILPIGNAVMLLEIISKAKLSRALKIDSGKLAERICTEYANHVFKVGQEFCILESELPMKVTVVSMTPLALEGGKEALPGFSAFCMLGKGANVSFEKGRDAPIELSGGTRYGRKTRRRLALGNVFRGLACAVAAAPCAPCGLCSCACVRGCWRVRARRQV